MRNDYFYFRVSPGEAKGEEETYPPVDLLLTAEEVCLLADVAGIPRQALEVKIDRGQVIIRGCRTEPGFFSNATHFYKLESFYGKFERRVPLPVEVDDSGTKVNLVDGVLEIRIPRHRPRIVEIPVD
jgi:HSP20 family protein